MNKNIIFPIMLSGLLMSACNSGNKSNEEEHIEEALQENEVSLTMQQMKVIDLKLGKIEKHNLSTTIKSNGRAEVLPQNKANITALVNGVVKNVFVIEGDFVKTGQTLATLEHPDIVDMQQQYLENVNSLEFLEQDYQRKKKLFDENVGSGKNYQKAQAEYNTSRSTANGLKVKLHMLGINIQSLEQGKISPTITVTSPIEGYVRFVEVNIGSFVESNDCMFEILDNRNIHADLLVYEKDIYKIRNGQEVHFTLSNNPGKELKGTIFSVGRAYENEARAITVHAYIENAEGNIIPGMYLNAHIIVDNLTTNVLPEAALAAEGDKYFIFVKTEGEEQPLTDNNDPGQDEKNHNENGGEWHFKKTEVMPGIRDNGLVEIKLLTPLPDNAVIVINTAYYLLAEMGKGETEHGH